MDAAGFMGAGGMVFDGYCPDASLDASDVNVLNTTLGCNKIRINYLRSQQIVKLLK